MDISADTFHKLVKQALGVRNAAQGRPFPVLVSGKELNLQELLNQVSNGGGYIKACQSGTWGDIASQLGFHPDSAPCVKLVYIKYLRCLENAKVSKPPVPDIQDKPKRLKRRLSSPTPPPPPPLSPGISKEPVLKYLKNLALDPGDAARSAQRERFVPRIKKIRGLLRKKEEHELEDGGKKRRVTKYSLRPLKPANQTPTAQQQAHRQLAEPERTVPVGPAFQVEVPDYKPGKGDEESMVFMGKVVWPAKQGRSFPSVAETACVCVDKRSIACINTHAQERRSWLKKHLGDEAFVKCGFEDMGERVANRWSVIEQEKFREVFERAAREKKERGTERDVWSELHDEFKSSRKRWELVSYYFNVFMLRRRAVQNRIGMEPDSDDDESELPEGASASTNGTADCMEECVQNGVAEHT